MDHYEDNCSHLNEHENGPDPSLESKPGGWAIAIIRRLPALIYQIDDNDVDNSVHGEEDEESSLKGFIRSAIDQQEDDHTHLHYQKNGPDPCAKP